MQAEPRYARFVPWAEQFSYSSTSADACGLRPAFSEESLSKLGDLRFNRQESGVSAGWIADWRSMEEAISTCPWIAACVKLSDGPTRTCANARGAGGRGLFPPRTASQGAMRTGGSLSPAYLLCGRHVRWRRSTHLGRRSTHLVTFLDIDDPARRRSSPRPEHFASRGFVDQS
jgi:hypothetical protein